MRRVTALHYATIFIVSPTSPKSQKRRPTPLPAWRGMYEKSTNDNDCQSQDHKITPPPLFLWARTPPRARLPSLTVLKSRPSSPENLRGKILAGQSFEAHSTSRI